jgi:phosphoribosylglycinamide formyltransferase-1
MSKKTHLKWFLNFYKENIVKKILVLASGAGSTLDYLAQSIQDKKLNVQLKGLVVDRSCGAIQIAKKWGLSCSLLAPFKGLPLNLWDEKLNNFIKASSVDYILLLGFLRKLESKVISEWGGKIINTHPSLLPKYGGRGMFGSHIHEAVIKNKEEYSGVTIHYVNENYDEGQVISQKKIKIQKNESAIELEEKIKKIEKEFLVETLNSLV